MTQKKIPRYRTIADGLIQAIVSRSYPVGSTLPAETELCEQLQASRHTVREALRIVEEVGLITRRQGSGSEVIADTPPVRYRQTVDSIEDLLQYGNASRFTLYGAQEVVADASLAAALGCAAGARCVELRGVRRERLQPAANAVAAPGLAALRVAAQGVAAPAVAAQPGRPFALSFVYFAPQSARRRDKLLKLDTALPLMLEALDARTLGRIEQTFEAVALDADGAQHLQVRKGAPSLRVHRSYYNRQDELILVAISWHRSDIFRYATVLRHESG